MLRLSLWDVQDVAVVLGITLYMCHLAGCMSIRCPQRTLTGSVQDHVLFSVDVSSSGTTTVHWTFRSGEVRRCIGEWQSGVYANITEDYLARVQVYDNGSLGLSDLRLQDAGFYVVTVAETGGSSRDIGLVLKVHEVIYEDLQYLSVSALALACITGLLMLLLWLLDKIYWKIVVWSCKKQTAGQRSVKADPGSMVAPPD